MKTRRDLPKTKIIATVGPSIAAPPMLEKMMRAGVNVFRINFSHGDYAQYTRVIASIRKISAATRLPVGILCDFQGPKLRVGRFEKTGGVLLHRGETFVIAGRRLVGTDKIVSGPFPNFYRYVKPGHDVYLNDGLIHLQVTAVKNKDVHCRVLEGGQLSDHKGINLPAARMPFKVLTPKDKQDIQFAIAQGLTIFAFSFIQSSRDVRKIRAYLAKRGWHGFLISKIEKPSAVDEFDAVMALSDGIMIARGDLGVEYALQKVPLIQKSIIQQCNAHNKVVITATQMLETMVSNPVPTRAEVSDVANAVFDCSDAVMLSAETASGKFPVRTVRLMRSIVSTVEGSRVYASALAAVDEAIIASVISDSAVEAAHAQKARAIVCHTKSGLTALLISKRHPAMPVIAFTSSPKAFHLMNLFYGVYPVMERHVSNLDLMVRRGNEATRKLGLCKKGDHIVIVAGEAHIRGGANFIKIHVI